VKSYRIYILGSDGRIQLGEAFEAPDDHAACAAAQGLSRPGQATELWEGGRIIGRVSKDGVFSLGAH
jgi:hypothetical protein